jgi:hypothetical protein
MSEKIISEIRFVETEDVFRIGVKGDMERLKNMDWGPGPCGPDFPSFMDFGPGRRFWKWRRRGRHGHGRHHGPPPGARPWWYWDADEPEEDPDFDMPPKNV